MKRLYARTRYRRNARLRRQAIVRHILAYLDAAKAAERNPWLADDLHVARQAVLHAANNVRDPWGFAFWWRFGKTYPKALIAWAERDRQTQKALARCAAMVAERAAPEQPVFSPRPERPAFNLYVTALAEIALPPKKPSQSVKRDKQKAA
jgi:hypothetical protein